MRSRISILQAIGQQAHDRGGLDPGNLLELLLALGERNEEDVAADVAAHHLHDLRVADVADAGDFDLVAGVEPEAPGIRAVAVGHERDPADYAGDRNHHQRDLQPVGGLARQRPAAHRNALLGAQKSRLFLGVEVEKTGVEGVVGLLASRGRRREI